MKQLFANCSVCFVVCSFFLLTIACKKNDHWNKPCCFEGPVCDAQTLLIGPLTPDYLGGTYYEPYKFTKTYGPDGRVNYLEVFLGPAWASRTIEGSVHYAGKRVWMQNPSGDTIMVCELNDCGQPVRATINSHRLPWAPGVFDDYQEFQYDAKGRLYRLVWYLYSQTTPATIDIYQYDQYDNILSITSEKNGGTTQYTYDYKRPIKGGFYDQGLYNVMGSYLLEFLGFLHTQPHHVMTKVFSNSGYPTGTWSFFDQRVNADGYLVAYKSRSADNPQTPIGIDAGIVWKCGKHHTAAY